mmetsp:Transcript_2399/g.7290  ORF Transcript_2399/g.7290 Transcript_2399/m.7290 type:complete len:422 (+) Transcript_2399:3442-4707(+)
MESCEAVRLLAVRLDKGLASFARLGDRVDELLLLLLELRHGLLQVAVPLGPHLGHLGVVGSVLLFDGGDVGCDERLHLRPDVLGGSSVGRHLGVQLGLLGRQGGISLGLERSLLGGTRRFAAVELVRKAFFEEFDFVLFFLELLLVVVHQLCFALSQSLDPACQPFDDHLVATPQRQLPGGQCLLAPRHEFHGVHVLLVRLCRWRDRSDERRLALAAQCLSQKPRQCRVAVWNVFVLVDDRADHTIECGEALVHRGGLASRNALRVTVGFVCNLGHNVGRPKVNEPQPGPDVGGGAEESRVLVALGAGEGHVHRVDAVRRRGVVPLHPGLVHFALVRLDVRVDLLNVLPCLLQVIDRLDVDVADNPAVPFVVENFERFFVLPVAEVGEVLVINLEVRDPDHDIGVVLLVENLAKDAFECPR